MGSRWEVRRWGEVKGSEVGGEERDEACDEGWDEGCRGRARGGVGLDICKLENVSLI